MGINMPSVNQKSPFERILGAVQGVQGTVEGFQDAARKSKAAEQAETDRAEIEDPASPIMQSIRAYSSSKGIQVPDTLNYKQFEKTPLKAAIDARIKADEEMRQITAKAGIDKKTNLKQNEFAAAGFSKMATAADQSLNRLLEKGFNPTTRGVQAQGLLGLIPQGLGESFKSQDLKSYEQAKRQFVQAVLRKESGATITPSEMEENSAKYFPQPGDGPDVLAQKAQARAQAVAALSGEGAGAMNQVQTAGYTPPAAGQTQTAGAGGVPAANAAEITPEDREALQWARANPNDRRASEIMKRLLAKGLK